MAELVLGALAVDQASRPCEARGARTSRWTTLRSASLALMLLLTAACPRTEPGGPVAPAAKVTWVSPGKGATNRLPLFPLRSGTSGAQGWVNDGFVRRGGALLLRQRYLQPVDQPFALANLYGETEEGVAWFGSEGAPLQEGLLLVPREVRLGMRWTSEHPELGPASLQVTQHALVEHAGTRVRWTIELTLSTGRTAVDFYEGLGRFLPEVIPLDDAALSGPIVPDLPQTPLVPYDVSPMMGSTPASRFGDYLRVELASVIVPPGQDPILSISGTSGFGESVDSCRWLGPSASRDAPVVTRPTAYHPKDGCYTRLKPGRFGQPGSVRLASHASGVIIHRGELYATDRGSAAEELYSGGLLYVDPSTDKVRILRGPEHCSWFGYCPPQPGVADFVEGTPEDWTALAGPVLEWKSRFGGNGTLGAPGAPPTFVMFLNTSSGTLLSATHLEGDRLPPVRTVARLAGLPSFTSDARGQHLLVVSSGGRIDRVVPGPVGTLTREALAHVTVPPGQIVSGAFDLSASQPGRLLVLTRSSEENEEYGAGLSVADVQHAPVPWEWPIASGVTATALGLDVLVCWPPSEAPLSTEGWTIGGVPARQVVESTPGQCARITRDVDADPVLQGEPVPLLTAAQDFLEPQLRFDVEGPVPGVGRVWVKATTTKETFLPADPKLGPVAPLRGGGWASSSQRYGPGFAPWGTPRLALGTGTLGSARVDASGAGLWQANGLEGKEWRLYGADLAHTLVVKLPEGSRTPDAFPDSRGGLVMPLTGSSGWVHLGTDGGVTPLPAGEWWARRKDGQLCGPDPRRLHFLCADPSTGAERGRFSIPDGGTQSFIAGTVLLDDDSFLISADGTVFHWDGQAAVAVGAGPLSDEKLVLQRVPGGVLCFGRSAELREFLEPGVCSPAGFTPLELRTEVAKRTALPFFRVTSVIVGEGEWLVSGQRSTQQMSFAVRVPRP